MGNSSVPWLPAAPPAGPVRLTADQRWIYDHLGRVRTALAEVRASKRALDGMAHARRTGGEAAPRIIHLAQDALAALAALEGRFSETRFSAYVDGFQSVTALSQRELYGLPAALKLVAAGAYCGAPFTTRQACCGVRPRQSRSRGGLDCRKLHSQPAGDHRGLLERAAGATDGLRARLARGSRGGLCRHGF